MVDLAMSIFKNSHKNSDLWTPLTPLGVHPQWFETTVWNIFKQFLLLCLWGCSKMYAALKKARFTFNFAFLGCSMLPSPTFSASPFYLLGRKGWRIYSAKIWIFETLCWVTSKNDLSTKNLLPELTLLLKTPQLQSHYSKSSCCIIVSIF